MKEIVKIGYKELTFNTLYSVLLDNSSIVYTLSKERVMEKVKDELSYYYLKNALIQEPIKSYYIILYYFA